MGEGDETTSRPSRLWGWFVAAFVLQLGAWVLWLTVAAQHKVKEVPLAESNQRSAVSYQPPIQRETESLPRKPDR